MECVVNLIKTSCDFERNGGRVHVCSDMQTCMVYDVCYFPDELITNLKKYNAKIEILAESTSLSGYVMRLTLRSHAHFRVLFTGAALTCMSAIVMHCLQRDI